MYDNQLIFLISQPRSGSSMVQQMLLSHDEIKSFPEPWQMLSLIYTYKINETLSGYNPKYATINYNNFLASTNDGIEGYKQRLKKLALSLYNEKLKDATFFLDKTPRYYHIIDELYELFPTAKFIFLLRNPIAVFASILDYNFKGDYHKFLSSDDRIDDLFLAPDKIMRAVEKYSNHVFITYEEVVSSPSDTIKKLSNYLSIDFPSDATYTLQNEFKDSSSIDTKSLHVHNTPVPAYLDSWKKTLNTTQKKKVALGFLQKLRLNHESYFQYDLDEVILELKNHKPLKRSYFNLSFDLLAKKEEKLSILELVKKRLLRKLNNLFGT
jgi:Sulfotransferase family